MKTKYQFKIKSLNKEAIHLYQEFLKSVLEKINIKPQIFNLPTKKKRITFLKSPHVNKTAREQFEIKYYKFIFQTDTKIGFNELKLILLNKPKMISVSFKKV